MGPSGFSGLWNLYRGLFWALPTCQLTLQILGLSASIIAWATLIIELFLNIYIWLVLFLWRILTNTVAKQISRTNIIFMGHKWMTNSKISPESRQRSGPPLGHNLNHDGWVPFLKTAPHYMSSAWESTIHSIKHSRVPLNMGLLPGKWKDVGP